MKKSRPLDMFLQSHDPTVLQCPTPAPAQLPNSLVKLSAPLRLPPGLPKLTWSQQIFSLATEIDIRSLSLKTDGEFFLFMAMRSELQWASFNMTSHKWVIATREYNRRLALQNAAAGLPTFEKSPRALVQLLGEIEPQIVTRVMSNNFICAFLFFICHTNSYIANHSETTQDRYILAEALLCSAFGQSRAS